MRILVTADLHYDNARSRPGAQDLARRVLQTGGDALVLVGDTTGRNLASLDRCLELFADFPGLKLLVPGNHCLWVLPGQSSLQRYEQDLPDRAAEHDFILLDHQPVQLGRVGLVGSVGWYDYAFADASLGIPPAFYRAKVAPGAAARMEEHAELIARHRDQLTDEQLSLGIRWMDGVHVHLPMSDEAFLERLLDTLRGHLAEMAPKVDRIAAFVHHLPFVELVPYDRPMRYRFTAAYMGSPRIGQALAAEPKVRDVYCGHSHWPGSVRVGNLRAQAVGSTTEHKELKVLEVPDDFAGDSENHPGDRSCAC
jgi:predicted phosphohydrolase